MLSSSEYLTFSMIGYIIIKSTMAIGSETFATSISDSNVDSEGKKYPIRVPEIMQITTHIERYLLNTSQNTIVLYLIENST